MEKLRAVPKEGIKVEKAIVVDGQNKAVGDFRAWLNEQQISKRNTKELQLKIGETKEISNSMRENKLMRLKPQSVEAKNRPETLKGALSTDELLFQLNFRRRTQNKPS